MRILKCAALAAARGDPRGGRRPSRRAAALAAARAAAPAARGLGVVPVRKRTGINPRSHSEVNFKNLYLNSTIRLTKTYVQGCRLSSEFELGLKLGLKLGLGL